MLFLYCTVLTDTCIDVYFRISTPLPSLHLCRCATLFFVSSLGVLLAFRMRSLNPSCPKAARGMERLEKLMRGVDPDDDDVDVGEGDGAVDNSTSGRVRGHGYFFVVGGGGGAVDVCRSV